MTIRFKRTVVPFALLASALALVWAGSSVVASDIVWPGWIVIGVGFLAGLITFLMSFNLYHSGDELDSKDTNWWKVTSYHWIGVGGVRNRHTEIRGRGVLTVFILAVLASWMKTTFASVVELQQMFMVFTALFFVTFGALGTFWLKQRFEK